MKNSFDHLNINTELAYQLVADQFPQYKALTISPVETSGWDNRTFHLGNNMLIRMPSAQEYAHQIEKESMWLPKLAPFLSLEIPTPLSVGKPAHGYPWNWGIYRWLEGTTVASTEIQDINTLALSLAKFLSELEDIDTTGGPAAGGHNFYRGGELSVYDAQARQAIEALNGNIDTKTAIKLWNNALATKWSQDPVWVHGDIAAGNLLVQNGYLSGVIDFGQLSIGDPACDLAIAWTLFPSNAREIFRTNLKLDIDTWTRGSAWALWKAMITAAGFTSGNSIEAKQCWCIIDKVLSTYKANV
jgi:aminoglycoside phosphotransferase (APT) family kinase protein